jgi:hypothetical protein
MGVTRAHIVRNDSLDGMLGDYGGGGKGGNKPSRGGGARNSTRLVASLTCLQLAFAIYATFLLYYMSPSVDMRVKPDLAWASRLAQHWKQLIATQPGDAPALSPQEVCEHESIDFEQKKSTDEVMIRLKRELYDEVLAFQLRSFGAETLPELLRMRSRWSASGPNVPRVTVILNHFKRRTLCAQLDQLRRQTLPFHRAWVLSFGSPNEASLRRIVESYNDSRISFVASGYDFKYYGRFQMALQSESDFVYVLDDDMIPGARMLEILCHVGGTEKYGNAVLGSIGRILPFRQKDFTFPSYRKFRSREAGLYLPDPAYDITVDRIVQVDFLSSSWFLPSDLVKTLFIETPFTFMTGEDLHLSYQLQKYMGAGSFVLPVDPNDKETWGDSEHRLAYVSETTVIFKDIVQVRDEQWWRALTSGYVTQWAAMHPQKVDALFYAHSLGEVRALAPLLERFRTTPGRKAYLVVSGGGHCPCEEAATVLKWPKVVCKDRRFKIFDLGLGALSGPSRSEVPVLQAVYASMRGIVQMHNPSVVIALADVDAKVKDALRMAADAAVNRTALVLLPRNAVSKVLWMATLKPASLPSNKHIFLEQILSMPLSGRIQLIKLLSPWIVVARRLEPDAHLGEHHHAEPCQVSAPAADVAAERLLRGRRGVHQLQHGQPGGRVDAPGRQLLRVAARAQDAAAADHPGRPDPRRERELVPGLRRRLRAPPGGRHRGVPLLLPVGQVRAAGLPLRPRRGLAGALLHLALHAAAGGGGEGAAQVEPHGVLRQGAPQHALPAPAPLQLGRRLLPQALARVLRLHGGALHGGRQEEPRADPEVADQRLAGVVEEVPHRHDVPARLRQPLPKLPQPDELLHQPHGARRAHQRQG